MAFLVPEYAFDSWALVGPEEDPEWLPDSDYLPGLHGPKLETKGPTWGYRLTAPGYMDQTPWEPGFPTEKAARRGLAEDLDVDPDSGDPLN